MDRDLDKPRVWEQKVSDSDCKALWECDWKSVIYGDKKTLDVKWIRASVNNPTSKEQLINPTFK